MFGVQMFLSRPEYWPVLRTVCSFSVDHYQSRHALHCYRHSGRDGDAAQSVSAFFDCAEPQLQADAEGKREAIFLPMWTRRWR